MPRVSNKESKNIYFSRREELRLTRDQASELLESIPPERIEKIEIDGFETTVEYSDEELVVLDKILQQIETEQKRFVLTFNPEDVKRAFAEAYEALTYVPETEKKTVEKKAPSKKDNKLVKWLKKYSSPAVAASLVAVSGLAIGAASRIYK